MAGNGKAMDGSQGTSGFMANMLGLGPIMQTVQDPAFLAQARAILDAIIETQARVRSIEGWCLRLSEQIERLEYGAIAPAPPRIGMGADGTGASAPTGGLADDGASSTQAAPGGAGDGGRRTGDGVAGSNLP